MCHKDNIILIIKTVHISYRSCASSIGRKGGLQNLYIGSACKSLSTILHEMMHAIGFLHEHTREDRDNYIELKFENIKPGTYSPIMI